MSSEAIQPEGTAKPIGVWSPVIVTQPGRMAFISGFTSRDEAGNVVGVHDIRAQTRQVCENLKKAMQAAGGDLSNIVSVTVFVRDITMFDDIHAVRREYFPDRPPTSTMVEVSRLVDERSLIEINAIAVLP
jgi:2-iminobutanoate/2-iminopropanoate deaminase